MGKKLTEAEGEFVSEMAVEPGSPTDWASFDPPFLRKAYDRFVRRGWLEYKDDGPHRSFRWTPAGRSALAEEERG